MATNEHVRAKELSTRDRGQLGNWLFTGYGDRQEKTPLATSVPKVAGKGPKTGPQAGPPSHGHAPSEAAAAAGPVHQRSGSAEARCYQARNRGNIGDIMGMAHEPAPAPQQPPSPSASRASTALESEAPSEAKSSPAKSSSSSSTSEKASVVAASEISDFPSPTESRAESVAASFAPSESGDAPDFAPPARPRSVAEEYAKRNKGTMDNTFGESSPRAPTTPRVKGTEAQAYANRNRGQLTSDQYAYGTQKSEPVVTGRPMSAKRQQDNMAGILGSGSASKDSRDSGPQVRSPRNAEARMYKDRNRGTMGDVLGGGQWDTPMPKRSLAHDSYN